MQPPDDGRSFGDQFKAMFGSSPTSNDLKNIFTFRHLSQEERDHLTKVYRLLAIGVFLCGTGVWCQLYVFQIWSWIAGLSFIAALGYILLTSQADLYGTDKTLRRRRTGAYAGATFSSGLMLAGLVDTLMFFDPSLLVSALIGALSVFTCLSLAGLFASSSAFMMVSAAVSTLLFYTSLAGFSNFFLGTNVLFNFVVYSGLLATLGFVFLDTQRVRQQVSRGIRDEVGDAVKFYLNLIGLFVRLADLLLQKEAKRCEPDTDDRRRTRRT